MRLKTVFLLLSLLLSSLHSYASEALQAIPVTSTTPGESVNLQSSAVAYHELTWHVTGTVSACTVALDSSVDGVTWTAGGAVAGQTCTTNGQSAVTNTVFNYVRIHPTAFTGTGSVRVVYAGFEDNPLGGGGPGGVDGNVQYNDAALFGGDSNFTWNKATQTLSATNIVGALSGNASTATALAADPSDCSLPNVALGVNAAGTAQCAQPSNVTGNSATATALASGLSIVPAVSVVLTSQASAIGTTNLVSSVAANSGWLVTATLNCDTTSAAATVNVAIGYTDPSNTAQTVTAGSAAACTALGSSSLTFLVAPFRAKASTAITYSTSIVNTPTYDLVVVLQKLTSN